MTRPIMRPTRMFPILVVACLGLAACATPPPASDPESVAEFNALNDPIEPLNRVSYGVHNAIDTLALRPAAEIYRTLLAPPIRTGIRNVLSNLRTPVVLLNDALQGETQRFGTTLGRFVLNTMLGVGGIFEVATDFGLPPHSEDFGQTLAVWGAGEGPFLFIPVLGPSNPRDLTGFGVDLAAQPLTWISGSTALENAMVVRSVAGVLDAREGLIEPLDTLTANSLDPYAALRSAYRQRRAADISNRGETGRADATGSAIGSGLRR